ncbi:uncharacterized protein LOC119640680 [Glossina fuscipes]|uniref:Uncharacterized protein LOC119640680 n=1 Tax=Glossina fuscipes TaxID=7396 RepID=A0A9C6DZN0_9MUSC|nr:uncharacterized protein LOC119640680 [Glossina fuscipes]
MIRNRKQRVTEKYDTYYNAVLTDGLDIPITDSELVEILKRGLRPEVCKELIHFDNTSTPRSRNFVLKHEFLEEELNMYKFSKPNIPHDSEIVESEDIEEGEFDGDGVKEYYLITCRNCSQHGRDFEDCLTDRRQLCSLIDLEVDRLAFTPDAKYEIHAFSDSSESAYGTCVYIRCINNDTKIRSNLLCAKSKVAPIKKCSLPRLELCAAVTMVQLVKKVQEDYDFIQFNNICFWTDATIVLGWISEDSCNWSTFIANRVAIIQQVSTRSQWRHIPSNLNPVDILSRGVLPAELMHSTFWFHGPNFLTLASSIWPQFPYNLKYDDNILERKHTKMILITTISQQHDLIISIKFHNDYVRLLNTVAYMLRFIYNCKFKAKRKYGSLDATELDSSRLKIIKYIRIISFHAEIAAVQKGANLNAKSHIQFLSPFLGNTESGWPIKKLAYYHKINHHVGPQTLLSIIRQSYWPIHGKVMCRSICRSCVLCFRTNPTKQNHLMGDLPDLQVQQSRPFSVIGVDFCGPFQIYYGRRNIASTKGYISVFICFCTKAIHLELVEDLSAQAFLAALRRFIGDVAYAQ